MNILALETTERTGSVAAARDGEVLAEIRLPESQRRAQSLAPGIEQLLKRVRWQPSEVDLVSVTAGPGSFTGLRIGVATAKTFAYAVGADVLGVDTHEVLAIACPDEIVRLSTAVDAQRDQLVTRYFARDDSGRLIAQSPSELMDIDQWLGALGPGVHVTGPLMQRIANRLPSSIPTLPAELWHPTAGNVARLAFERHAAGCRDDLWKLVPVYSRPSAAEEKQMRARRRS